LKLLEKYLPHDGKYKDVTYDIQWKNFTSGAPLTNEMLAGKLDIGSMADFPGSFNGAAFQKAGKKSEFITVLSGSTTGSGNGIVVPKSSTGAIAGRAERQNDFGTVRLDRARHAAACDRGARLGASTRT
jgi:ABC-type nitrate/sulfonate/bicarbonate transport system substrate-binding protein